METAVRKEPSSPEKQYETFVMEQLSCTEPSEMGSFGKKIVTRLEQEPESVAKHFWLGNAFFIQASADKSEEALKLAIDHFEHAARLDPKDQRIYSNLMGAYQSLDDMEGFRKSMVRAIENDPNPNAEKRAWLAGQQATQKMYCQACGSPSPYESGLNTCPICKKENPGWIVVVPGSSNPQVQEYKDKAARYYSQGLFQDAIEQLQAAAKIDPTDATLFNNLGVFFMKIEDYGAAKKNFKKAVELNPKLEYANKMLSKMEEKGVDKSRIGIPSNLLVENPAEKLPEHTKIISAAQTALNSKTLAKSAQAVLAMRLMLLSLTYGENKVKEAEPYWDKLQALKKSLPPEYAEEYQKLKKVYDSLYTEMVVGIQEEEPVEEQKPDLKDETPPQLKEAKRLALIDPKLARQALLTIEEQLKAQSWPFGKCKIKTEIVQIWYLFDRATAIERMKDIPKGDLKQLLLNLNKISPLQPEEWDRLIVFFTQKNLSQDVWDGIAEQKQISQFSKELLLGLAPLFIKWAGNTIVMTQDSALFQNVFDKFEWLMRSGCALNVAPAFEEILVKFTKMFERIQLWWVGFSLLELMIQLGVNLSLIHVLRLPYLMPEIPTYLHHFIRAHTAVCLANPDTAQTLFLNLKRDTQDNQQALGWFLVNLVKRGYRKTALDLASQSGRYNELSQRVHRTWITLDLNDARKSIPADDFAGDSIGEFLIQDSLEKRVEYLRSVSDHGSTSLPGQLWVFIPKVELKKNIFGATIKPHKTFEQETEEFVQNTPVYSSQKTMIRVDEKFTDYLRTAGFGEYRYQTIDPVLQETLVSWTKSYPQEVKSLVKNLWAVMIPQDFLTTVDWLRNEVLERITSVLAADPEVFCDEVVMWFKKEWVDRGRRLKINNQDVQFKLEPGFPFSMCVRAAMKIDKLSPKIRDQIITFGLSKYKCETKSIVIAAGLYGGDKNPLDFTPPFALQDAFLGYWQQGIIMSSAPALEKAFQSQKAQIIGLCDLCNQVLQKGQGKPYTADEFRALVAKGFEPPEAAIQYALRLGGKREQFIQQWKFELVAQSTTGWMLCPVCQEKAEKYHPEPGIKKIEPQMTGMGLCDICNKSIVLSDAKSFTPDEFQQIVSRGFEPPDNTISMSLLFGLSRESFLEGWKQDRIQQSSKGWILCPDCTNRAYLYF